MRRVESKIVKEITEKPGWWTDGKSKRNLLSAYFEALRAGTFINRSAVALEEARYYVYLSDTDVGHERSRLKDDPSGAGENHADRVIADAVLWEAMKSYQREVTDERPDEKNTFHARRQERIRKERDSGRKGW